MANSKSLEREGRILPEESQGEMDLESSTNPWVALVMAIGAASACAAMAIGGGTTLTWIGAVVAAALFVALAWVASRGIDRQNDRVEELMSEKRPG
ncbi:MAG: hypothetical protein R3223_07180 [Longimicrobiales bacterium]|nr:hypothetical protein [Longimicrobiales bacterium]